jgi:hypothetical protein
MWTPGWRSVRTPRDVAPPRKVAPRFTVPDWVTWAVREHGLNAAALAVLVSLCQLGDEEWTCSASERDIAENVGLSRSTVQIALTRLLEIRAVLDLGRAGKRSPRKLRVSAFQPPTAAQLRLLATSATRRATLGPNGGWLVAADEV